MSAAQKLALLPSLTVFQLPNGRVSITRKFIEGVEEFRRHWQGPMTVLIEAHAHQGDNLDNVPVRPSDLPFTLKIVNFDHLADEPELQNAAVVLGSVGCRQNHIPRLCNRLGVPCVLTAEYSLSTRYQIVDTYTPNWLWNLRQRFWERRQEKRQVKALREAQGVQCNGTPIYESYQHINANPLLYFDTRVTQPMLATASELKQRSSVCLTGRPLRLLFSGRLIPMKGAQDLIQVARHLQDLSVDFQLTICGEGESSAGMREAIQAHGLSGHVHMANVLDFHTELIPKVKHETDLFVCCHRQGDPSCTYLETMSCGVPIVGYDNEAFVGVVKTSGSGWLTPMNQPLALAQKIASLSQDRPQIEKAAHQALAFAQKHTFEQTFQRRIEHLRSLIPPRTSHGLNTAASM
jgi:colanic acid/amylovoran biosynthesis glycosyltransferase